MRIPYTDNPPKLASNEQPILERVLARRGATGLLPLDLALLHAPQIADGWNSLLGAVRTRNSLPDDIREIAICRPALINGAWFEWKHHAPLLVASAGFNEEKLEVVKQLHPTSKGPLDDRQWAVLRYADAMTRGVKVENEVFEAVKKAGFSEQEIIEITTTVACYNMVSRFLVALDVGEANSMVPEWYKSS